MSATRPVHPDFLEHLQHKDPALIELFLDARQWILEIHPEANELLYKTHALTAVFSVSDRLGDAFCMLPIYTNHFNLGFNKGTQLPDPHKLLIGTGTLIRHINVTAPADYRNPKAKALLQAAIELAISERTKPSYAVGLTIVKFSKM